MPAPYGDGLFLNEPPAGHGLNITDLFHIVVPKPGDPGNDSRVDSKYPNVAIITPDNTNNRFGGMWAKEQLDLSLPFSTEIYLHLGHQYNKSKTVADGMTFTLHNDNGGIDAIGGAGEGLGVYRGRKWMGTYWNGYPVTEEHGTFLRNSLVIEFDTYRNTISDGAFVDDPAGPYPAHCSLLIPRSPTILIGDHKNNYFFTPSQDWVKFEANWTPNGNGGGVLDYTFDGHPASYTVNNIISTFGGTKVWWGFTGATGYYTSVQAAAITRLPEQGIIAEKTVKNKAGMDIDKGTALPGDIITYTIRVTSRAAAGSIGPISIDDEISEHLEYTQGMVKVTTKSGDEFEVLSRFSSGIMTVFTGQDLSAEGDWIEITFDARVKDNAAYSIVYNKAVVEAGLPGTQDTNTTEVRILAEGDPEKSISDESAAGKDKSKVKVGDEITYNISYTNFDTTDAAIVITDVLPGGVDFVTATDGGDYSDVTNTVTWSIPAIASGATGVVSLVVRVNESAVVKLENSAEVTVGVNEPRFTNIVENPVAPENPEKSVSDESAAGRGGSAVKDGDEITYDITYLNYEETSVTVIISDKLHAGLDFVSATDGGEYNATNHVVTWTLTDVPSAKSGTVFIIARVNESAVVKVENEAAVRVGGNNPLITNMIENPVTPQNPKKKVSDDSGAGQGGSAVKMGDEVTYEITYLNHEGTPATVVITDRLPDGVDFVSASGGGKYDDATHTVVWTLQDVPSGTGGTVSIVVRVNQRAVTKIENSATVQVGGNEPLITNIVVNPVNPEPPEKKVSERSAAGKSGSQVKVGDEITYDVIYRNYLETAATILITDWLPAGVDFVSASNGGTHQAATHTVAWTIPTVAAGDSGIVSVVVRVNEKAVVMVGNYATVQVGDNEPQFTNLVENPAGPPSCPKFIRPTRCRKTIKGHKMWVDNGNARDTRPPAVDIILMRDNEAYKSISIPSAGNGAFAFGCLPVWKNSNHRYDYKIDEATEPKGYTKKVEGYNITNTLD